MITHVPDDDTMTRRVYMHVYMYIHVQVKMYYSENDHNYTSKFHQVQKFKVSSRNRPLDSRHKPTRKLQGKKIRRWGERERERGREGEGERERGRG